MQGTNNGGRFRSKRVNFSMVSNSIIRDTTISLKAKGLYSLIQSYITIENYTLYKQYLMRQCVEGERAFDAAWKELKARGYLKQYKYKGADGKMYYEYDLLDVPDTSCPEQGGNSTPTNSTPTKCTPANCTPANCTPAFCTPAKRGSINNTLHNKTIPNNIESNHILPNNSAQPENVTIEEIRAQIEYDYLVSVYQCEESSIDEIVLLMQEVYRMNDNDSIRIAKRDIGAFYVKERFKLLTFEHINHVYDRMVHAYNQIKNPKAFMLTVLYNAPVTLANGINAQVAFDMLQYNT